MSSPLTLFRNCYHCRSLDNHSVVTLDYFSEVKATQCMSCGHREFKFAHDTPNHKRNELSIDLGRRLNEMRVGRPAAPINPAVPALRARKQHLYTPKADKR